MREMFKSIPPLWLGVIDALSSTFMIAVLNLFAKLLAEENFHAVELVFLRNLFGICIIEVIAFYYARNWDLFRTGRLKDHILRSTLGTLGVGFIFAAYAYLPLTTAVVLIFTSSLMIPVLGLIFLGESVGPYRWAAVVIGFAGVVLMTGFSPAIPVFGFILAMLGAFFNASVMVALRSLGQTEHPLTTAFYFMLFGMIMTLPILPFVASGHYSLDVMPYIAGLIFFGSVSHIAKNAMYIHLPAAVGAPFVYTALIWSALFDFTVFGYIPDWSIWAGGAIVIFSNLFLIWRENRAAKAKAFIP